METEMKTEAKVILDSVNPEGVRLTTIEATYPRCIHSEFMTHRVFSRNAASSRAIPAEKQIQAVRDSPFMPFEWQMEAGGMQGTEGLPAELAEHAEEVWRRAADQAMAFAEQIRNVGEYYCDELQLAEDHPWRQIRIHKTMPNRITEPWSYITVIISGTEWDGFFQQRCHPDAEIHMREMAECVRDVRDASTPQKLMWGQWHLPYVTGYDFDEILDKYGAPWPAACQISAARCARVSYMNHSGVRDWDEDLSLFERLKLGSGFGHRSPAEHVAQVAPARKSNFRGNWHQLRKLIWDE